MRVRKKATAWFLVLTAGCGPALSETTERASAEGVVWLDSGIGLTEVDLSSGKPSFRSGRAVASPDHSRVFTYRSAADETELSDAGKPTAGGALSVPGELEPAVVSGSGELVALTESQTDASLWEPTSRPRTEITVADVSEGESRTFELEGNFEPEAFSVDDRRLYTIEYIPALAPTHYRVRILRLRTGKVSPIGRLKTQAPGQMRGTGRMQEYAPDGDVLYTLYTQQGPNSLHGDAHQSPNNANAFIHVLNLQFGWAHCVDLPQPFGTGDATASAIAVSPSGMKLYVTDWSNGAVAIVDPARLEVMRSADAVLGAPDDETFAAAGDETLYVAGNDEIVAIEVMSLEVTDRWTMEAEVDGLERTSAGDVVAVVAGELLLLGDGDPKLVAELPS
ncbi:MAG TPA: hypothetical protein VJ927_00730 [Actinomycetota bacterium]|nr:hypothetical protein [Actinomycetota bacterium]